jgi:hypothetical protein
MQRATWVSCVRSFALWLTLGAVSTVAISWLLAAYMPQSNWPELLVQCTTSDRPDGAMWAVRYAALGCERRTWRAMVLNRSSTADMRPAFVFAINNGIGQPVSSRYLEYGRTSHPFGWPAWGRVQDVHDRWFVQIDGFVAPDYFAYEEGCEHATGWPCKALWYTLESGTTSSIRGGIALPLPKAPAPINGLPAILRGGGWWHWYDQRALPFQPIWAGLLIDSLFWSMCLFGVCKLASLALSVRRRGAGRCISCGYDLRGISTGKCPECGTVQHRHLAIAAP